MSLFTTSKAVAKLAFRLGELSSEVQDLKTANKHLELEWEELYDKVRHQMARMSKRSALGAKAELGDPPLNDDAAELPTTDPISAKILARRGMRRQAE